MSPSCQSSNLWHGSVTGSARRHLIKRCAVMLRVVQPRASAINLPLKRRCFALCLPKRIPERCTWKLLLFGLVMHAQQTTISHLLNKTSLLSLSVTARCGIPSARKELCFEFTDNILKKSGGFMTTLTSFCLSLCLAPHNISIRFLDPDDQLLKDAVIRGRLWFSDRLLYSFQPQHLWLLFLFALCNLFLYVRAGNERGTKQSDANSE